MIVFNTIKKKTIIFNFDQIKKKNKIAILFKKILFYRLSIYISLASVKTQFLIRVLTLLKFICFSERHNDDSR